MSGQIISELLTPKHICVLRLSAIGDVCHAVAMVQAIQKQWPDVKVTWIIGKIEMSLLQGLPGVEFVVFDKHAGLRGYVDLKRALRGRHFDVLLHMQVALRASLASLCVPAKMKLGFDRQRAKEGQWLFSNVKIPAARYPHVLEGFMDFARAIGVDENNLCWDMPLAKIDECWARQHVPTSPYVVIAPAASKLERTWSTEGYSAIAKYLYNKGFTVVICGGPAKLDRDLAAQIGALYDGSLVDLVGQTNLKQLLAVLKHAHLVIAPDTGPAHMAVTVNTPVIGLYAHSNPRRTGPYKYQHYVVSVYEQAIEQQYGKPWTDLPWGVRAKGEQLMQAIDADSVKVTVDRVLEDFYPDFRR